MTMKLEAVMLHIGGEGTYLNSGC